MELENKFGIFKVVIYI